MKVKLKCPIRIGKVQFAKGENEIPADLENHWFVQALVKSGDMTLVEAQAVKSPKAPKAAKAAKPAPQPQSSAS